MTGVLLKKAVLLILLLFILVGYYVLTYVPILWGYHVKDNDLKFSFYNHFTEESAALWNYRNYSLEKINSLSTLGKRLFLNENVSVASPKHYLIYVHKYGKNIERRLIKQYGDVKLDPFGNCSVHNCILTYNEEELNEADAVLFHLHLTAEIPQLKRPNYEQIWVWLSDESPYNTLMVNKNKNLSQFDGMFNWSMTYRSTSDVPVPYGRTVPLVNHEDVPADDEISNIFLSKPNLVAIMGSNCGGRNGRQQLVKELQKHISVDYYGRCGTLKCPGHFTRDCHLLDSYKFYLSFENSNCEEYITEKAWWNAFHKKSVPVVLGASRKQYEELFPPNSFIYAEDFNSPKDLAVYLRYLSLNEESYNKYHAWRKRFKVVNEHGYFQSSIFHYCRLCEALNYNSHKPKVYESMLSYWDKNRDCYPTVWNRNFLKS